MHTAKKFPWEQRWLNGSEYHYLLKNINIYDEVCGFSLRTDHPTYIYTAPKHGDIYFLTGESLRSLGFPRVKGLRKRFKWKKMNFTTPLPKQSPKVHYLVATGKLKNVVYRMHIASLTENTSDFTSPLLCHVLKIKSHRSQGEGIPSR